MTNARKEGKQKEMFKLHEMKYKKLQYGLKNIYILLKLNLSVLA